MTRDGAEAGCTALGPGWRLPNRLELMARAEHLARIGGRDVTYWVDEPRDASGYLVFFVPKGRLGEPGFGGAAGEGYLADVLCLNDAPPHP